MTSFEEFEPDWASPPGETVADILASRAITKQAFAKRLGRTTDEVNEFLRGSAQLTSEVAVKLSAVLGASTSFWLAREARYRATLERLASHPAEASAEEWVRDLPVADMLKFQWLDEDEVKASKDTACFRYFGVRDVAEWNSRYRDIHDAAAFRTSPTFNSDVGAVAAWLRRGELLAAKIPCGEWSREGFAATIPEIRALVKKRDPLTFLRELKQLCAKCGVAVVVARAPSGCRASGATRFLTPIKALLLLSFRYLSDDHFWFTFFHEAGHLLLHSEKRLFIEGIASMSSSDEDEANQYAARTLIPPEFEADVRNVKLDAREIIRLALRVGISPGVLVGQLQHMKRLGPDKMNRLKRRFSWE
ncbi:MAG: ImmA/IrrE family metallo-endopeptidase [Myxococcales bacterium]|nr:ImmA/IrrE family metallo-endopeptidase [Myxococcales bacterium]